MNAAAIDRAVWRLYGWLSRRLQCRATYTDRFGRFFCMRKRLHLGAHRDYLGGWPS